MPSITNAEIEAFSKYILEISSIYLDKSKGYLLETRLKELMDESESSSYSALLDQIKADSTKKLHNKLIDAISTNETFFFRDNVPFDLLRNKIIPDLIDLRQKQSRSKPVRIRIWSAACSTGQEVYSVAITLLELLAGMGTFDISILGTDISSQAVSQASYGKYNRYEIERGLAENKRQKYFTRMGDGWRIKDEIRALVKFETINLTRPFPAAIGPFDVVFCRNVAIYFQIQDKVNLFKRIARIIAPGGSLIVGGSENLLAIAPDFVGQQYLRGMYYTLKSDENLKMNDLASSKPTIEEKTKRTFAPIQRKTVYDKKRPPVAINKRVNHSKKEESPQHAKANVPGYKKEVPPAKTEDLTDQSLRSAQPSRLFGDKRVLEKNGDKKVSLLDSIGSRNKSGTVFLKPPEISSSSKASLLDKINLQKQKKKADLITGEQKNPSLDQSDE